MAEVLTGVARRAPLTISSLHAASLKDDNNEKNGAMNGATASATTATNAIAASGGVTGINTTVTTSNPSTSLLTTVDMGMQNEGPSPDEIHELFGLVAFCGGSLEGRHTPYPHHIVT